MDINYVTIIIKHKYCNCRFIFKELATNYKSTENPAEWVKATKMLLEVKEGYYLIQPRKMKGLAEELRIKTEFGKLSVIMS